MKDHELRDQGPPNKYDNTMRTSFLNCQRKFYWFLRGFDYQVRPAYFTWGSAWELMKGTWYSHEGCQRPMGDPLWQEGAREALDTGLAFWADAGAEDDKKGNTRAGLETLWIKYLRTYPNEPFKLVTGGAELGWLYPLPGTDWFLGGALDGYIEWEPYGTMALEEKTTSIWLSDFFISQYSFSSQITQYIWYLTQILGSVHGCLVNMVTKRVHKGGTTPQFARSLQERSSAELKEFERDWHRDIEDIHRSWDRWHFPKTTDVINCTGGIGKSPCLYKGICLSGLPLDVVIPSAFPGIVERKEDWAPWDWGVRAKAKAKARERDALPELWNKIERRPIYDCRRTRNSSPSCNRQRTDKP